MGMGVLIGFKQIAMKSFDYYSDLRIFCLR
jgi:hypothetical protein